MMVKYLDRVEVNIARSSFNLNIFETPLNFGIFLRHAAHLMYHF